MKGLLWKDFYMAKKYCRTVLIMILLFLAVSLFQDNSNIFFVVYPTVIASILPVSLQAYDEKCRWVVYGDTFPYSRGQLVSVKYLMSLCFTGAIWICTLMAQIVKYLRSNIAGIGGMTLLLLFVLGLSLLSSSILLPVIFKLGTEKGRIAYMVTIAFICGGSSLFMVDGLKIRMPFSMEICSILFLSLCLLIFGLSWLLSIRIYRKKEF